MSKLCYALLAVLAISLTVSSVVSGEGYSVLHEFSAQSDDGKAPWKDLIIRDDKLYGMTMEGGLYGLGTAFSIIADGTDFTLLHSFAAQTENGIIPYGSLVFVGDNLYGMTYIDILNGAGTVFSLHNTGMDFTLLHRFSHQTDNGTMPMGSLVSDGDSLYGMTSLGGVDSLGAIFSLSITGNNFDILHSFSGGIGDGQIPYGSLILEDDTLYGMTSMGGQTDGGVVFSIGTGGGFSLIHDFTGAPDGGMVPFGNILLEDGTLFGMTVGGGVHDEGTIFSLHPTGNDFTIIHSFSGKPGDGANPWGSLVMKNDALYGMTSAGGQTDVGVIFSLRRDGSEYKVLHEFVGLDGMSPFGSLILDGNRLYGMTSDGGVSGGGVIFSYQLPPPPWITDYNGDGVSDIAIFRESTGLWAIRGVTRVYFGNVDDEPIPGDYNGDGTTDIGIFRDISGLWAVRGETRVYFGGSSDIAVPGDYDGDGLCDIGIFRRSSGLWALRGLTRAYFGSPSDIPLPGYYGADPGADIGIFRGSSGVWAVRGVTRIYFGGSSDDPVPGDYNGDGVWEPSIYRASSGLWAIRGETRAYFGGSADYPIPADYSGDAIDNIGIFRPSSGLWAVKDGPRVYFGGSTDLPVTR